MRRCTRRAVNRLNLGSSARFRLLSSGSTHIADISQITLPGSATGPCAAIVQSPPPLCLFCIRGEYEDSTYLKTEILRSLRRPQNDDLYIYSLWKDTELCREGILDTALCGILDTALCGILDTAFAWRRFAWLLLRRIIDMPPVIF
jgi:hypothetical protein